MRTHRLFVTSEVDRVIRDGMERWNVPGLACAVWSADTLAYEGSFGVRDVSTKSPVDSKTVFDTGSLSKPLFAYAILELRDKGLLELDKPLASYLPAPYAEGDPRIEQVTARMALSHTSGLPNWRDVDPPWPKVTWPVAGLRFVRDPGLAFGYSGEGYVFVQAVVEQLTGEPLDSFMRTSVLHQFGMTSSSYSWIPAFDESAAIGHDDFGNPQPKDKPHDANAAYTLHSTPIEYVRFVASVLLRPVGPPREMLVAHAHVNERIDWGLGWGLSPIAAKPSFWHWGDNDGVFQCFAAGSVDDRWAAVVMTNSGNGLKVCDEVVQWIFGERHPAFLPGSPI